MKFIKKLRIGIPILEAWKKQEEETLIRLYKSKRTDAAWKHLPSKPSTPPNGKIDYNKRELKGSLNSEQGFICCYCQRRIGDREFDHDIEHLIPKSTDPEKYTFNYSNVCISCKYEPYVNHQNESKVKRPLNNATCNEARGNSPLLIFPTNKDIETKFRYAEDGKIYGINSESEEAIKLLNLNAGRLIKLRMNAIEAATQVDIMDERIADVNILKSRLNFYSLKKNDKHTEFRQAILFAISIKLGKNLFR